MFDFPASPTVGQQVTTPARVVLIWDGVKWYSNYPPPSLDVDFSTAIPADLPSLEALLHPTLMQREIWLITHLGRRDLSPEKACS